MICKRIVCTLTILHCPLCVCVCVSSYRSHIIWPRFSWPFLSSSSILRYRFVVVCVSSGTVPSVLLGSRLISDVRLQYQGLTDLHSHPVLLLTEPHSVSRTVVVIVQLCSDVSLTLCFLCFAVSNHFFVCRILRSFCSVSVFLKAFLFLHLKQVGKNIIIIVIINI